MQSNKSQFKLYRTVDTDIKKIAFFAQNTRMLITSEFCGRTNVMTANSVTFGFLFGKPVAEIFLRPNRFTFSLIEGSNRMSLSFLPESKQDALRICGSKSGSDTDKFKAAGLTCVHYGNVPYIEESESVFICKKLYAQMLKEEFFTSSELLLNYREDDLHKLYIYEIEKILSKK